LYGTVGVVTNVKQMDGENVYEINKSNELFKEHTLAFLTPLRKKSPTSKREGAFAPVKVGDEFRLGVA
jgi:hypothetical protein